MGSLESYTKLFDQGKVYKLLKRIIKAFSLLIGSLLKANIYEYLN